MGRCTTWASKTSKILRSCGCWSTEVAVDTSSACSGSWKNQKTVDASWNKWHYGLTHSETNSEQQSVRRTAKHTSKEFQEVSEVSNTSPNARIWSFLVTAILCFASCCSLLVPRIKYPCLYLLISLQTSRGSGYILALCPRFRFHVSLLASPRSHHSFLLDR